MKSIDLGPGDSRSSLPRERWVLITGASTGIGRACTEFLASHGFFIYAGARKEKDLNELQAIPHVIPLKLDVTDQADIDQAVDLIHSKGTGLFGLINNAGLCVAGALMDTSDQDLERQFRTNLFGIHQITKACFPFLLEAKGRVVMMGSDSGFFATPFFGPYCSSKFALEGYADSLRRELMLFGVKVVIIQAGRVSTPIWDKGQDALEKFDKQSIFSDMVQKIGEYAIKKGKTSGLPPVEIGRLAHKILSVKSPRIRYLIAPSTFKYRLIKILPGAIVDRMIRKELSHC